MDYSSPKLSCTRSLILPSQDVAETPIAGPELDAFSILAASNKPRLCLVLPIAVTAFYSKMLHLRLTLPCSPFVVMLPILRLFKSSPIFPCHTLPEASRGCSYTSLVTCSILRRLQEFRSYRESNQMVLQRTMRRSSGCRISFPPFSGSQKTSGQVFLGYYKLTKKTPKGFSQEV